MWPSMDIIYPIQFNHSAKKETHCNNQLISDIRWWKWVHPHKICYEAAFCCAIMDLLIQSCSVYGS